MRVQYRSITNCLVPSSGPQLLRAVATTSLSVPDSPTIPSFLSCAPPPLISLESSIDFLLTPSHILAISSRDSTRTLLLPVHGLIWSSKSPVLSFLSSNPHPPYLSSRHFGAEELSINLPVVNLSLPSSLALPLLQAYIYLSSPSLLLSSLLPTPPTTSRTSLSPLLNPTPLSLSHDLSSLSNKILLEKISLLHGLWGDVVALRIGDEELWKVMGGAWGILVGALAVKERRGRREI